MGVRDRHSLPETYISVAKPPKYQLFSDLALFSAFPVAIISSSALALISGALAPSVSCILLMMRRITDIMMK